MIILIGGDSHTGKTLMAQTLLERYHFPYMSLDHLKMGLVRGWPNCPFQADDPDEPITSALWGIVKGIILTCLENQQNLILEGCYFPYEEVAKLIGKEVAAVFLGFSDEYLQNRYTDILRFESVIESRGYEDDRPLEQWLHANALVRSACARYDLPYFEVSRDYESDLRPAYAYLEDCISRSGLS